MSAHTPPEHLGRDRSPGTGAAGATSPNGAREVDERDLAARVAALSLKQKVRLLTGADLWTLHAEPAVGLRRIVTSDGPAGVRGGAWDERDPAANVPCPTALAASWDEPLAVEIGQLLAEEARRKGVDVVLAPMLNLQRSPYGGRHFECFSEDPLLAGRIGAAFVRGVQAGGVAATAKHFIANDSERERMTVDVHVGERALRELYLAPFETVVREGGVWSAMASYNRVNGCPMTESPLLRGVLRGALGFDGVVMSDWFAARSTVASARSALDLVMPGPDGPWGGALLAAVRRGAVDEAMIDEKVLALLRLASRVGALDGRERATPRPRKPADTAAVLRRAAAAGFVLVRNDGVLPLDRAVIGRLAVIGPNAATPRTLGGGSATVFPPYTVTPLAGLRAALGDEVTVDHCTGARAGERLPVAGPGWLRRPSGEAGVEVRFVAVDGSLLGTENRATAALHLSRSLRHNGALAWLEIHTVIRASASGPYVIGASGIGRYRLSIDGRVAFDTRLTPAPGADLVESLVVPPQAVHTISLAAAQSIDVTLAHEVGSAAAEMGDVDLSIALNLLPPQASGDAEIDRAVALADAADVVVVVVGTSEEVESEGFDRDSLALPGRQDELMSRVAAANCRTIAIVNTGAPVLLPWADDVAAILLTWFPGQEFGHALADVLLGLAEPGGRLPMTWPSQETGLPSTRPVNGTLSYGEGLGVGYRSPSCEAAFAFGHGLGFSRWEYLAMAAPGEVPAGAPAEVAVEIRNTGSRRSREVVQVYASRPDSALDRPARWLAGFAPVSADPGETVCARVPLAARVFEHWDAERGRWAVEAGQFHLGAGRSCVSLYLTAEVTVRDAVSATRPSAASGRPGAACCE
ncbi:MAG TPA: glycoside hydrolase family 3 C-terminal domain-containing protein [Solirubrobacteraceae bacterium]|nr:glycoside hydrolase family 3 C-terminal domain-containing protein [Solirubrobacteraceae bacterium]